MSSQPTSVHALSPLIMHRKWLCGGRN